MPNEEKQKRLQEMLCAARGALEEALDYAEENDLWFDFSGLRRGPGGEYKTLNVNDEREIAEVTADHEGYGGNFDRAVVSVLDISEEWVGSWC